MKRLLAIAALIGCGSAPRATVLPPPAAAVGLDYQDPQGSGWRLVRDPSSTVTRLVLGLQGPAGTLTRGAGLNLQAPAGVRFGVFASGLPVENAGVYQLGTYGSDDASEPVAIAGGLLPGNVLTAGVFQKDRGWPAQDSGAVLLRIAIEFDPKVAIVSGTTLPLQVVKARVIPEDIGGVSDSPFLLMTKLHMPDVTVAVGTVTAR